MSDTKFIAENESNLQDLERGETEPGEAGNLLATENPSAQQIDTSGIAGKEFSIRAAAYIIDIVIIILFSMLFIFIAGFLMGYIFPRFGLWFDENHER